MKHNREGNCWDGAYECHKCGAGNLCDVCHQHDEPRGQCSECPDCPPCLEDEADNEPDDY